MVSRWNASITEKLERGATEALKSAGARSDSIEVFQVPGAFELPIACLTAAKSGKFDAIVALGVVIRGDTPHFDYVAGQAASGIMQSSMQTGVPVMFGVITADTEQQALDRSGEKSDNKGFEAALSAVEMVNMLAEMQSRVSREKTIPNVA